MSTHWQSTSPDQTIWAGWDGIHVVYHRPSSKTHVLNGPTAALLREVLTKPKTTETAARELAERQGQPASADFTSFVARTIMHLEHVGLVERA